LPTTSCSKPYHGKKNAIGAKIDKSGITGVDKIDRYQSDFVTFCTIYKQYVAPLTIFRSDNTENVDKVLFALKTNISFAIMILFRL